MLHEPKTEYTPIPFWFWNDELSKAEITRQIQEMHEKGVDGFVIHPRKGMPVSLEYLSEEYFEFVKHAVKEADERGMKVVLYDEAMYPSGSCSGRVVAKDPQYASKGLLFSEKPLDEGVLIAQNADGYFYMVDSMGTIRGVHEGEDDGEEFAPRSTDLLNPQAVEEFIRLTHDKYYEHLSFYFGNTVIAMFTDEPNILGRNPIEGVIPWSSGIYEEFLREGGQAEQLTQLFSADPTDAKRIYETVIYKRMSECYYKKLSEWCTAKGIGLTGHPETSTDIGYMKYFKYPAQDVVWRFVAPENNKFIEGSDSCMAKCSSDAARHRLIERNGNECFGCCGRLEDPYLFTDEDMRMYLNWLFVRGVNLIFPHAFYYSIRDGRGDERPPEVGMNNPFWSQYKTMSNYIKRMCELLTGTVNQARAAILCTHNRMSWQLAKPLFENQIEFNYLEEELLGECRVEDGRLMIAEQVYDVVLYDDVFEAYSAGESQAMLAGFQKAGLQMFQCADSKSLEQLLESKNVGVFNDRPFSVKGEHKMIRTTHLKKAGEEYVVIYNESAVDAEVVLSHNSRIVSSVVDVYREQILTCNEREAKICLMPYELKVVYFS